MTEPNPEASNPESLEQIALFYADQLAPVLEGQVKRRGRLAEEVIEDIYLEVLQAAEIGSDEEALMLVPNGNPSTDVALAIALAHLGAKSQNHEQLRSRIERRRFSDVYYNDCYSSVFGPLNSIREDLKDKIPGQKESYYDFFIASTLKSANHLRFRKR